MNNSIRNILLVTAAVIAGGATFLGGYAIADRFMARERITVVRSRLPLAGEQTQRGETFGGRGYGMGPGMMTSGYGAATTPLTLEEAKDSAEAYLRGIGNPDLFIEEIMIFDNNAYVVVKEKSSGMGAFELLVDPVSKSAYPEYGPNMMWNLKYGMMGGGHMMGGYGQSWSEESAPEMTISLEEAIAIAQDYLDAKLPGATVEEEMAIQFYGYYTLDFQVEGAVTGMLSVHGFSGEVFLHTWHGTFLEEMEY